MPIPPLPQRVLVRHNGSAVGDRRAINFLSGATVTWTVTDDAGNGEVEVTPVLAFPAGTGVFATHGSAQSANNDADTTLTFTGTETVDTDGFHDTGTNPSRLTVPSGKDGTYQPVVALSFAADADGYRQVTILKNGSPVAGYTQRVMASPTLATGLCLAFPPLALVATDYLECRVRHTAGAALDVESGAGFGMWLVSSTGGAPANADYVVETAQSGLTAESVLGTTVITTAAYASRPAAAKAGRLFLPSDGLVVERDTGSAWASWGPIFPLTAPVDGDFAWVNQGGASVNAASGGIHLLGPAGVSASVRVRKKAAPATPWTLTAAFIPGIHRADFNQFGLIWRQSSDGKLVTFGPISNGSVWVVGVNKWTDATTFSAGYSTTIVTFYPISPVFLRITDDGTNRVASISADGVNWEQIHTIGRADFLTANEFGFYVNSQNATYAAACTLLSWKQS